MDDFEGVDTRRMMIVVGVNIALGLTYLTVLSMFISGFTAFVAACLFVHFFGRSLGRATRPWVQPGWTDEEKKEGDQS